MMFLRTKPKTKKPGLVYLLRAGKENLYKIGITKRLPERLTQLVPQCPYRLDCAHVIRTDDMYGVEGHWHSKFRDKRLNGEWFALSPEDIQEFSRLRFATIDACGHIQSTDQTTLSLNLQRQGNAKTMGINLKEHVGTSKWLKAEDITGEGKTSKIVTINDVQEHEFDGSGGGTAETKLKLILTEFDKPLILNKTNTKTLIEICGDDTDEWPGEVVKLVIGKVRNPQTSTMVDSILIERASKKEIKDHKERDVFADEV